MASIVEDLRINVFGNGKYLHSKKLIAPDGSEVDSSIMNIHKVLKWMHEQIGHKDCIDLHRFE